MDRALLLKEGATQASVTDFPIRRKVAAPKGGPMSGQTAAPTGAGPKAQAAGGWLRETTQKRSQAPMVQPTR